MFSRISIALALPLIGWFADLWSMSATLIMMAVATGIISLVLFVFKPKELRVAS